MNKTDKEFLKKVAKQSDDAYKLAKKALETTKADYRSSLNTVSSESEPTQTWVQFSTPAELQAHASEVMSLNQEIDKFCKRIGLKELRVTFKKP